nr:hypothetical protein [Sporolactobacillus sp. THM19-2]
MATSAQSGTALLIKEIHTENDPLQSKPLRMAYEADHFFLFDSISTSTAKLIINVNA